MPTTGEKPGQGTYQCIECGQEVVLNDDSDTLPPCPNCDSTEFEQIG
jgi:DNA-directed RNA polymerase subunit RPC12/RpoP